MNTASAVPTRALADVAALRVLPGKELRALGRLARPMVRRHGEPGFTPDRLG